MARGIIVAAVVGIVVFLLTSSSAIALAAATNQTSTATGSSQHFSSLLTVRAEGLDGRELVLLPLIFSHQGNVTIKEAPAKLNIPSNIQNYTITAPDTLFSNFDNATFGH
jgi:hypothetical protein